MIATLKRVGHTVLWIMVAAGFALLFLRPASRPTGPAPLTPLEESTARDIARSTNVPIETARVLVMEHRPSAEDERRWAYEREQRDSDAKALHSAACQTSPWATGCQ